MKTEDFDYLLPEEMIAQFPLKDRDYSKLLVLDKKSGNIEHKHFYDICEYFNSGDVLVLNDTRVLPARIFGNRPKKDEKIEVLLLSKQSDDIWECLVRPDKKMKIGTIIEFSDILKGEVLNITESGERIIKFTYDGIFENILDEVGIMPLPPYIHKKLEDKERYQTIYSKYKGSVAAPTAGLHFTEEVLRSEERRVGKECRSRWSPYH